MTNSEEVFGLVKNSGETGVTSKYVAQVLQMTQPAAASRLSRLHAQGAVECLLLKKNNLRVYVTAENVGFRATREFKARGPRLKKNGNLPRHIANQVPQWVLDGIHQPECPYSHQYESAVWICICARLLDAMARVEAEIIASIQGRKNERIHPRSM